MVVASPGELVLSLISVSSCDMDGKAEANWSLKEMEETFFFLGSGLRESMLSLLRKDVDIVGTVAAIAVGKCVGQSVGLSVCRSSDCPTRAASPCLPGNRVGEHLIFIQSSPWLSSSER